MHVVLEEAVRWMNYKGGIKMKMWECLDVFFLLKKLNDWYYEFEIDEFNEWFNIYEEYPTLCKKIAENGVHEIKSRLDFLFESLKNLDMDIHYSFDLTNKFLRIDWYDPLDEESKTYTTSFDSQELM